MSFTKNPMAFWLVLGLLVSGYHLCVDKKIIFQGVESWGLSAVTVLIFFGLILRVFKKQKFGEKERLAARVDQLESAMKTAGVAIPAELPPPA